MFVLAGAIALALISGTLYPVYEIYVAIIFCPPVVVPFLLGLDR